MPDPMSYIAMLYVMASYFALNRVPPEVIQAWFQFEWLQFWSGLL